MFQITPIEKNNQRVLTTAQIAEAYDTNGDVISKNFNRNKDHYQDGKHFYLLKGAELRNFLSNGQIDGYSKNTPQLYLWTEKGALLHAKSLNTEKAWAVYNELVDFYFRVRTNEMFKELADLKARYNALLEKSNTLALLITERDMTETICHTKAEELRGITREIVTELLGENTVSYRMLARIVYRDIWSKYRREFHLDSYKNTLKYRFDEGAEFLENWEPDDDIIRLIGKIENAFEAYLNRYFDDYERDGYKKLLNDYPVIADDFIVYLASLED